MDQETVIRLARAAGMIVYPGDQDRVVYTTPILEALAKFADLVAMEPASKATPNINVSFDHANEAAIQIYIPEPYQAVVLDAIKEAFRQGEKAVTTALQATQSPMDQPAG